MDFNGDTQDRAKLNLNDISANDGVLFIINSSFSLGPTDVPK